MEMGKKESQQTPLSSLTFKRVETAEGMKEALLKQKWDIIISDYEMPRFSVPEALELLHKSGLDIPFIIVSGAIGEETAVDSLKAGAHDFIMKSNLSRFIPAIKRELHEARYVDFRGKESLGLHLVNILADDQLHGSIKLDRNKGTSFRIKFKGRNRSGK